MRKLFPILFFGLLACNQDTLLNERLSIEEANSLIQESSSFITAVDGYLEVKEDLVNEVYELDENEKKKFINRLFENRIDDEELEQIRIRIFNNMTSHLAKVELELYRYQIEDLRHEEYILLLTDQFALSASSNINIMSKTKAGCWESALDDYIWWVNFCFYRTAWRNGTDGCLADVEDAFAPWVDDCF